MAFPCGLAVDFVRKVIRVGARYYRTLQLSEPFSDEQARRHLVRGSDLEARAVVPKSQ